MPPGSSPFNSGQFWLRATMVRVMKPIRRYLAFDIETASTARKTGTPSAPSGSPVPPRSSPVPTRPCSGTAGRTADARQTG